MGTFLLDVTCRLILRTSLRDMRLLTCEIRPFASRGTFAETRLQSTGVSVGYIWKLPRSMVPGLITDHHIGKVLSDVPPRKFACCIPRPAVQSVIILCLQVFSARHNWPATRSFILFPASNVPTPNMWRQFQWHCPCHPADIEECQTMVLNSGSRSSRRRKRFKAVATDV